MHLEVIAAANDLFDVGPKEYSLDCAAEASVSDHLESKNEPGPLAYMLELSRVRSFDVAQRWVVLYDSALD